MRSASGLQIEISGCVANADWGEIGRANQLAGQIYRHNLRMHAHAKLSNPYAFSAVEFRATLQSNEVYPPRSCAYVGIARQRINAIR